MTLFTGAALGTTTDKTKLVVGDAATIDSVATRFSRESQRIEKRHDALKALRIAEWSGVTADAWETSMGEQLPKWLSLTQMLDTTSTALQTYADALRSAQGKAQEAIDLWAEGDAKTASAVAAYNSEVRTYNRAVESPVPGQVPQMPGPFVDTGAASREQAEEILEQAREDLDEAGARATRELGMLPGSRTSSSGGWTGAEGDLEGPSVNWDWWDKKFGDPKSQREGPDGGPFSISLGTASGDAWVFKKNGTWEDYLWGGHAVADGEFRFLTADGSAEGVIDKQGLKLNADGTLTLVGASGSWAHDWERGGYGVSGEAAVEASARGEAYATTEGVHVGGEAFAGGRASGTAEGSLFGITVDGTAEGWAGAGAGADGVIGWDDGKLRLHGGAGLAWGLGGKLSGGIEVDLPELGHNISDGAQALQHLFD